MRVPVSWLAEHVDLPAGTGVTDLYDALISVGLEVERVERVGADVTGVVVGEVLDVEELTAFAQPIRWCQVRVASDAEPRGIICGAQNFAAGDRVPVALPGARLPGRFEITARKTYDHVSDGMICSARELGAGVEHSGILVLARDTPVGADAVELLHLRDAVLDIAVTPDRGYALSVRGIARELATALGVGFRDPTDMPTLPAPAGEGHPCGIEDPTAADRFMLRTVTGVDAGVPAPLEMQRRLHLSGVRPVSLAVDVTNYVMHELGQPLHAFDRANLTGPVVVRRAWPGERLTTLDHVDRVLDPDDVLIADDSGPLSLAGTMGGLHSEIGPSTRDIVVEAAHFAVGPTVRMSRRHGLASEASRRFERGVDPALPPVASARAVALLVALGGGTYAGTSEVDLPRERPTVRLAAGLPGRVAGLAYDRATVVRRLEQVGCTVVEDGGPVVEDGDNLAGEGGETLAAAGEETLAVTPPSWRPDLVAPYDLVEEVVRLEGYDTIGSELPRPPAGTGLTRDQLRRRAVADALAGTGLDEVLSMPFCSAEDLDTLGVPADDERRLLIEVTNPLSEQARYVRSTLLPPLLETARRNLRRGANDLAIFEIGSVALDRAAGAVAPRPPVDRRPTVDERRDLDAALPDQPLHVAAVLYGAQSPRGWWGPGERSSWADAARVGRTVARAAGVPLRARAAGLAPWHPGRCAALLVDGTVVGHAGELHPRVIAALELPARTCAVEVDLTAVLAVSPVLPAAPVISTYPPATQDVALVVADDVPAADVSDALAAGAGPLLESIALFDVFTDERFGADRRSLAYALSFRATDRTLTVEEATAARDAAVAEAARRTGATLRT